MDGSCFASENRQMERDTQSHCAVLSPLAGDQLELITSDLASPGGGGHGFARHVRSARAVSGDLVYVRWRADRPAVSRFSAS